MPADSFPVTPEAEPAVVAPLPVPEPLPASPAATESTKSCEEVPASPTASAEDGQPPPPPDFPFNLPREFGPGPEIRAFALCETGERLEGLRVRTTTWRPTGRGCFKPTYHLGWSEIRPGASFAFHVDAEMLRTMPERKGRVPFTISADGHEKLTVTLDASQWADLERGWDLAVLEFRLKLLRDE